MGGGSRFWRRKKCTEGLGGVRAWNAGACADKSGFERCTVLMYEQESWPKERVGEPPLPDVLNFLSESGRGHQRSSARL